MVNEWEAYQLDSIATFTYGKMPKSNTLTEGQYPTFSGYKYQYKYPEYNCDKGDVIVVARGVGGTGDVKIVRERCYLTNLSIKITLDTKVANNVFFYYRYLHANLRYLDSGSAQSQITINDLRKLSISLPPLSEQRAIAHILGTLDDKIELNRQRNETLETMARTLFKDWFVDFGPVRAKMEGREPPGLTPEIAALFPDALNEVGVPQGWDIGTLGDLATLNPESWSKKNPPIEIEYVDLANTKWGAIQSTTRFAWTDAPSRAQRILRPGDTIVGTVRPGNGSYSYVSDDGLTGSTGFAVLRPKHDENRELLYLAATSSENIERLSHLADGGAYPAVRAEVVLASPIILPDSELIVVFSGVVALLIKTIEQNKHEAATFASLRDLLLPKLILGDIRVRDAEQLIGEVV